MALAQPGNKPSPDTSHSETHPHIHYPPSQKPFPAQKGLILISSVTLRCRMWEHLGGGAGPLRQDTPTDQRPAV